jgi:cell division protease FtsH
VFQEISTGATDDLAKATDIARSMVMRFGMGGEDLGEVAHEPDRQSFLGTPEFRPRAYAEATVARIHSAVRALIAEASRGRRRSSPATAPCSNAARERCWSARRWTRRR